MLVYLAWILIIVILIIIEAATVNLVTIWYVASAIAALILSLFVDNFLIQFGVFVILGTILLLTTRKTLEKFFHVNEQKTNFDRIIGMTAIVTEEIDKNKNGAVKVDGKVWTAYSDKKIKVDKTVKVLEINGVKLKVEEE